MTERYTDAGNRVLANAVRAAKFFSHHYIGTEHLLLGIAMLRNHPVVDVLEDFGFDQGNLYGLVRGLTIRGLGGNARPYTTNAKQALANAAAATTGDIGPEHIMFGFIVIDDCVAVEALTHFPQVSLDDLRTRVASLVTGEQPDA